MGSFNSIISLGPMHQLPSFQSVLFPELAEFRRKFPRTWPWKFGFCRSKLNYWECLLSAVVKRAIGSLAKECSPTAFFASQAIAIIGQHNRSIPSKMMRLLAPAQNGI